MGAHNLGSQNLAGRGGRMSDFETSLVYMRPSKDKNTLKKRVSVSRKLGLFSNICHSFRDKQNCKLLKSIKCTSKENWRRGAISQVIFSISLLPTSFTSTSISPVKPHLSKTTLQIFSLYFQRFGFIHYWLGIWGRISGPARTHTVDQASLKHIEICLIKDARHLSRLFLEHLH